MRMYKLGWKDEYVIRLSGNEWFGLQSMVRLYANLPSVIDHFKKLFGASSGQSMRNAAFELFSKDAARFREFACNEVKIPVKNKKQPKE